MKSLSLVKACQIMIKGLGVGFLSIFLNTTAHGQQISDAIAPEFGASLQSKTLVKAKQQMVVSAHPEATKAGLAMLNAGGSAIDAMIATQLVLGLVEPQSSGLGGGAFLIYHDSVTNKPITFDGRETAPIRATDRLFIGKDGKALKFFDAVVGGRSVGTPGTVALLEASHKKFGKLPWAELFKPAVKLARDGFTVTPRLNASITRSAESLFRYKQTRNYFFSEEGVPIFTGTVLKNIDYAKTLQAIADDGSSAFYQGPIAEDITQTVQNAKGNPGLLMLDDLAQYKVIERDPVCFDYRIWKVCGMGPPSSGALTIGQILGIIEPYDMAKLGPRNPESWRLIGEASRLAFADRARYMADSDFVKMPKGLLNKGYLSARSKLIAPNDGAQSVLPTSAVQPGNPPFDHASLWSDDQSIELPSTSHLSIVDRQGNVVSMTTTIENGFGSRLMVGGFLLNNELTDFSFVPELGGNPVANKIEPGKRPRSSMAPTIVYKHNKPWLVIGSPGGSRIIGYVAKTLIAATDWGMDIQSAIDLPHLINRFGAYDVEEGSSAESFAPALSEMGYKVVSRNLNSGLHGIMLQKGWLEGGADPRREGIALGK